MTIILNQKNVELPETVTTVGKLVEFKGLPTAGVAVAVNNRVVPKNVWADSSLNPGDKVTIITAVCGG